MPCRDSCFKRGPKDHIRKAIYAWCGLHKGVFSIEGPAARKGSKVLESHSVKRFGPVLAQDRSGECLPAAIANAVDLARGRQQAQETIRKMQNVTERAFNLGKDGVLATRYGRIELRKLSKSEKTSFNSGRLDCVLQQASGIYIVRIVDDAQVDHCVVIDSEKRIIVDCYEQYPVELSRENLVKCEGDRAIASRVRVAEVHKVVKRVN